MGKIWSRKRLMKGNFSMGKKKTQVEKTKRILLKSREIPLIEPPRCVCFQIFYFTSTIGLIFSYLLCHDLESDKDLLQIIVVVQ